MDEKMRQMPKESEKADLLRKMGFKKIGQPKTVKERIDEQIEFLEIIAMRTFNRNERRSHVARIKQRVEKIMKEPSFTREPTQPPITRVTDEVSQDWEAPGHIDLSALGFLDNIEWASEAGFLRTNGNKPDTMH